jgi:hypothetical protein
MRTKSSPLLEPSGLWSRVLSFDPVKLKQILGEETVAEDIKRKIAALKQVISTSARLWVRKLVEEE